MLRPLNLTEDQQQQIKAIVETDRQAGPPALPQAERQLHAAIFGENPDPQAIETARNAVLAAQGVELAHRVTLLQKIAPILTADQRQQLLAEPGPGARGRGRGGV